MLYHGLVIVLNLLAKPGAISVNSAGMNISACAKMMGITLAAFIFSGMY